MASASPNCLIPMMLTIAISMAMLVSFGQSRVIAEVEAQAPVLEEFPLPDPFKCWAAVRKTGGCSNEVEDLVLSGQLTSTTFISPTCCTALADLAEGCWSKLFPLNPFFPAAVQSYCAAVNGEAALGPVAESGAEVGSDFLPKFSSWGA